MSRNTETEILDILRNQGVSKVEKMKRRMLVDTYRYILTFNRTKLPFLNKLTDRHREIVDVYILTPLRCIRCQRLEHTKNHCHCKEDSCAKRSDPGHKAITGPKEPFCINCREAHPPIDRQCNSYRMKCEIFSTQLREHVTHREAAERVHERFAQEGKSFSAAASKEPTYKKPRITINNKPVAPNIVTVPIADTAAAPARTPAPASACSSLATNDSITD